MDPRLLRHYNLELQHLREMGAEFAEQFPKIAARLGMSGAEVADPYVERLLEGVGFLAARVQLKLEAEFPRFTQALLEIVYPHYLAPTPAMLVAQFKPDPQDPNLAGGPTIPRGSPMQSAMAAGETTACEFRTAHDVRLWPVAISAARCFAFAPDLPLSKLPIAQRIKGGVRIRLKATGGLQFAQTSIDRLVFYVAGQDEVANRLHELCATAALGALVLPTSGASRWHDLLPAGAITPVGFEDNEALLPVTPRSFQGYRLLQEYFSFPQRYRFFEVTGLAPAMRRATTDEIELVILFGRDAARLEDVVDASNFALYCTPAINLFPKRADRIQIADSAYEYHVVADRTRPLDFEIYQVTDVMGHGVGAESEQRFLPLYATSSVHQEQGHPASFTARREPRLLSSSQKRRGPRTSYIGTEVFLALVDSAQAPYSRDLRQLSVQTLCTNRDLPLLLPLGGGATDLSLDVAAPVTSIRVISGPSRPYAPLADGAVAWRAISHLSLNYVSLVNASPEEGATALRELLGLYAPAADQSARKQIDGIRAVSVKPVTRRLPDTGPLAFGRGLAITVTVDELAFEGGSACLLGSVLARFFARHVSINSFTETILRSDSRDEINRWMPRWGARPTL
jgi:type VI secretion system protein ImpG